ncbi:MAG: HAMP domain-containing sensor histidine kinase [Actinomycetota bacterium]
MKSTARRQLKLAAVVIIVIMATATAVPWLWGNANLEMTESSLRNGQAAILFAAASLGLLSGRWAARTSAGFAFATLLVLAFAAFTSAKSLGEAGFSPVIYTGSAALAVALLLAAAAAPEVKDAESVRRVLARDGGPVALLALAALIPVVEAVLGAAMAMPLPARIVLSVLVAAAWFIAGILVFRLDRPRLGWLPAVLMILGVAALVHPFVGQGPRFLLVALGLEAIAGIFALVGAVTEVRSSLVGTSDGMTSMLQDLGAMRDEDSRRRAEEVERLHEVRSVLAGLQAATGSLRKYEDSLDPGVRRRLQEAVGEELSRLNQLIDPATPEATEELDLEAVLTPVMLSQREQGLVVTTDLANLSVLGRASEIATLVSDLLVNARVHAPGSPVELTARADGPMVALEVRNWGPELSAAESERVFERAYRGSRPVADGVPGSGLGLYTARKLARQMDGDLQLSTPAGGGCCFVVTLPAARRPGTPAPSPQLAAQPPETADVQPQPHLTEQLHAGPWQHDDLPARTGVGRKLAGKVLIGMQRPGRQRRNGPQ